MGFPCILLYNMNMAYFDDMIFDAGDHLPDCRAWIDRQFPNLYALNFAAAGRIRWRSAQGALQTLPAPVAWWTWPGPRFVYGALPEEGWDHFYLTFHGPRAQRIFQQGLLPTDAAAAWKRIADAEAYARAFAALLQAVRLGDQAQAVHLLEGLCLELHKPAVPSDETRSLLLAQILERIRRKPGAPVDFGQEAHRLHLSLGHFARLFHRATGTSPRQYVLRTRLELAARKLWESHQPIKRISAELGFRDVYYFSRMFKKRYALPPAAYRRETQGLGGGDVGPIESPGA